MQIRIGTALLAVLIGIAGSVPARAQDGMPAVEAAVQATATIQAARVADSELLVVDGVLDETVWRRAEPATDFRQLDPNNGEPATERTEVRMAFDRDRLVLGVICFDSEPTRLLGNQMQRDQPFEADDRFMWGLDPYLDGRTGYFFEINPAGAMGDGIVSGPGGDDLGGNVNKSWDGIWTARVRRTPEGWTAEIELPFKTLNFNPSSDTWGANFQRTVRRKNEESLWTGWLRNEGLLRMSNAGRVVGLADISQGVGLDVKPYALGSLQAAPGFGAPATEGDVEAGIDLFYNITPALRANFTVNTDFAETEVDDRQVNLTRYPLFFPEKREFFLAGANFYEFPPTPDTPPFFSRRIGLNQAQPQSIL
ncbi:MAG: carbohydrate binding family 9 domain-containing protein, partial [Acidobacteria bacterium]|nr:carbohydrate binding family 9 domain-containing protein [Acidobacteriota bacterium]